MSDFNPPIALGFSERFDVDVSNLDTSTSYTLRLSTDSGNANIR